MVQPSAHILSLGFFLLPNPIVYNIKWQSLREPPESLSLEANAVYIYLPL
jgi:hypothetical protein